MSWLFAALLACAVVVLVAAEWSRLAGRFGTDARRRRNRARRKASLRLLREEDPETEAFTRSVERDLSQLPTIEERDRS